MTKSTRRTLGVLLFFSFLFALALTVLRILSLRHFDFESGYYGYGAILPQVLHYLLLAAVLFFLVSGLYLRKKIHIREVRRGVLFYSSNALLGAALAAFSLFYIPFFFTDVLAVRTVRLLLLFSVCLALLGVFYCLHNCLTPTENADKRLLLGLSIPLMCVLQVLYEYFETTVQINNPNKLLDQFAFAFVALYLLAELRTLFGEPRYAAQCTLGMIAFVFTTTASVPSIVYTFLYSKLLYPNAAHDVLMLSFSVYIGVRLVRTLTAEGRADDTLSRLLEEAENPAEAFSRRAAPQNDDDDLDEAQITFDFTGALADEEVVTNTPTVNEQGAFSLEALITEESLTADDVLTEDASFADEGDGQSEDTLDTSIGE